jgi:hypothetical protein
VAGGRRGDGQGPFWGDLVGSNPTERAKNGVKRSLLLVEAGGGPLAAVVAGANVRDDKLLWPQPSTPPSWSSAPSRAKKLLSTCAWTRATTTTGRR